MTKPPFVVPSTTRRDLIISIGIGVAVLALLFFGVMNMGSRVVGNTLTGTIVAKKFTPAPEEQVTIGKGGVHARHIDGEYLFEVDVDGRVYNVWVKKEIYEVKKEGETFVFPRPR